MKEDFAIIEKGGKEGQDAKMINETKQDHVFYRIVNGMIRLLLAGAVFLLFLYFQHQFCGQTDSGRRKRAGTNVEYNRQPAAPSHGIFSFDGGAARGTKTVECFWNEKK